MPLMNILNYPDPYLRNIVSPVTNINSDIKSIADNMLKTMYQFSGIGLAANQVGLDLRLIVLDVNNHPMILINPEIIWHSEEYIISKEGCLSIPGIYENVKRHSKIRCIALDHNDKKVDFIADDILSICIQHEIDHLNGKLFIDYLSNLKKDFIKRKIKKNTLK
ncbi:Peptide deformylase [Candidatus Kinetoplastibacterium sorsogonicusi]|uniref:Peptide deformylase n=1 Tax=Candidatus Kinetoplastidibacterium kentomonadis TaxID=1576550 RepID=A0A3Q8ERQ9_9PROT|nr:peptide deformylase [Candidatus Kinetoplastibacterium sorsogonicusi]AWD32718.1 Peptide deformylase [Candidatus Kinetoplastibacterium sorsogonicusi]